MNRFGGSYLAGSTNVLTMLICEMAITEGINGPRTLIRICNGVHGAQSPVIIQRLFVYVEFQVAENDLGPFYFGMFDPSMNVIIKSVLQVNGSPPTGAIAQMEMPLVNLAFQAFGEYSCQVFSEGRILMERKFYVQQIPPQSPPEQADSPTS